MTRPCGQTYMCAAIIRCGTDSVSSVFFAGLTNIPKTQKDANKQDFEIKLTLTCQFNHQNNRDLNQGIFHLWSEFGGPSLNRWWVIARTSSKWGKFRKCPRSWPNEYESQIWNQLKKYFFIYRVNGALLMNVARKCVRPLLKIEFCDYPKTRDLC